MNVVKLIYTFSQLVIMNMPKENKQTNKLHDFWPASELHVYQSSSLHLSAKLVPTFAGREVSRS
jgi:hypothetical protein